VLDCGVGRLVGRSGERLEAMLEEAVTDDSWLEAARAVANPFGDGWAGERITTALEAYLQTAGPGVHS